MRVAVALAVLAVALAGVGLLLFLNRSIVQAAQRIGAPSVDPGTGEITIVMRDFSFTPGVVRLPAGREVRIRIVNKGKHTHEFMVGRAVHVEEGVTEPPSPSFFEGLRVQVVGKKGMAMVMGFEGMKMNMMNMDKMKDMEMKMPRGAHADMEMAEGHRGAMVMLAPGAEATLVLTVPPGKEGVWVFGCFQEEGLHFDAGMRGQILVGS